MAEEGGEKKHEASPYRRQKAREDGQVPRSQDLGSAALLLIAVLVLQFTGPKLLEVITQIFQENFTEAYYWETNSGTVNRQLSQIALKLGIGLAPLMLVMFVSAIVVNIAQSGWLFLPEKLNFDFQRINPLSGFSRIFSLQNSTRLGFGLLKIGLVAVTLLLGVWNQWNTVLALSSAPVGAVASSVWELTTQLCVQAAVVLLVLAGADYGFQRWKYEQDLMMTDEEVREEMKSTQGDPAMKARRRRVQRELIGQRIQQDVPKADAVVTNPTELAVALRYDPMTMKAPIVVAKGADHVAARIRKIALEHGIPIIERKPLAQALFKSVEVGQAVPVKEYAAVSEILRYVYQIQGKKLPDLSEIQQRAAG